MKVLGKPNSWQRLPEQAAVRARMSGLTIIELLIALVLGMMTVLAVMQVSSRAEVWRRNATVGADAQTTLHVAAVSLNRDLAQAGGNLPVAARECTPGLVWARYNGVNVDFVFPVLPVVITTNPTPAFGDRIQIVRTLGPVSSWPIQTMAATTVPADPLTVSSPEGFASGGLVLVASPFAAYGCLLTQVSSVAGAGHAGNGSFDLAHGTSGCLDPNDSTVAAGACKYNPASGFPTTIPDSKAIYSLGKVEVHRYEVQQPGGATSRLMLGVSDFGDQAAPAMAEAVESVMYIRAYYGFDTSVKPDGQADLWLPANSCTIVAGAWSCTDGTNSVPSNSNGAVATRLVSIRYGMVTRSVQHDKNFAAPATITLWNWNCPATTICPTIDPVYAVPSTERDFRYQAFQTTIALRNPAWNQQTE